MIVLELKEVEVLGVFINFSLFLFVKRCLFIFMVLVILDFVV